MLFGHLPKLLKPRSAFAYILSHCIRNKNIQHKNEKNIDMLFIHKITIVHFILLFLQTAAPHHLNHKFPQPKCNQQSMIKLYIQLQNQLQTISWSLSRINKIQYSSSPNHQFQISTQLQITTQITISNFSLSKIKNRFLYKKIADLSSVGRAEDCSCLVDRSLGRWLDPVRWRGGRKNWIWVLPFYFVKWFFFILLLEIGRKK